tara:strand:- start:2352 stop:2537 length:186 start_codon:yes stop_codon:yes gene_type:complete
MTEEKQKENLLKKGGKWSIIIGAAWIGLNILIPLYILRIPEVQRYLLALKDKLPIDIRGFG